jgi:hypothetical protein
MEIETNLFLEYREGRNIFKFHCPCCGCDGELAIPATHNRNALVACPQSCGAQFMVRLAKGLFAKPALEFAFGPRRKEKTT